MIPRLKPHIGWEEWKAAIRPGQDAVAGFEEDFARAFGTRHALAFPYGRSALWAAFSALGIRNREIVLPAYTCSVVAHAIVLSGNEPRFVDVRLDDYTMDLDRLENAISERTGAVLPTHLFGYPMDVNRVEEIVRAAEQRFGRRIVVIQDCAHSFRANFGNRDVTCAPDMALFGLNISKMITSIFGGMLTTNDDELAHRVRHFRDQTFTDSRSRRLRRLAYLAAVYPAFSRRVYGAVEWLQSATPVLDRWTKAYHLDESVHFPPDYLQPLSETEAAVGRIQLRKYDAIVEHRRALAALYHERLNDIPCLQAAPLINGATYSHYVIRSARRNQIRAAARRRGVQLGELIEYAVPELEPYRARAVCQFPNARLASHSMINLPVHCSITHADAERIAEVVRASAQERPGR